MGGPLERNGFIEWKIMDNPIKMDDLGYPYFRIPLNLMGDHDGSSIWLLHHLVAMHLRVAQQQEPIGMIHGPCQMQP